MDWLEWNNVVLRRKGEMRDEYGNERKGSK